MTSLLAIAPGPTRVLRSSATLGWRGFVVEKHLTSPGERPAQLTDRHVISLLCDSSAHVQHSASPSAKPVLLRAGSVALMPAGPVPFLRLHTRGEFVHCALQPEFAKGVMAEMNPRPAALPQPRTDLRDAQTERLLRLLCDELEAEAPLGGLYVDCLAHALTVRFLGMGREGLSAVTDSGVSPLPTRILNRVQEKIAACFDTGLSLKSLAEESGYSRAHFLRMFRAATGVTPHQYVLELRLKRAQESLRHRKHSLIDVAALCGFASQSHMTSVFRRRLGVTPGEFRRECAA